MLVPTTVTSARRNRAALTGVQVQDSQIGGLVEGHVKAAGVGHEVGDAERILHDRDLEDVVVDAAVVVVDLHLDVVDLADFTHRIGMADVERVTAYAERRFIGVQEVAVAVPIDVDRPRSVGARIGKVDDVIKDTFGKAVVSAPASTTGATLLMPIDAEYWVKPPSLSIMRAFTVRGLSSPSARKLAGTIAELDVPEPA